MYIYTKLPTNFINWYDMLRILTFCMFFRFPYFYTKTLQTGPIISIVYLHIADAHFFADTVWLCCQSTTKVTEKWQKMIFMLWKKKTRFKYFKHAKLFIQLTNIVNNEVMRVNVIIRVI